MLQAIERQRYFIDYSLSSLARRRGKNLGLLTVYSLIVFLLASVMLFTQSLRQEAAAILKEAPEILVQRIAAGRQDLIPAAYLERMGSLRGVSEKRGRLWGYHFDPAIKANYTLMTADQHQLPPDGILIGAGIARARGLGAGDFLSLRGNDGKPAAFRVEGILPAETELISSDLILMAEPSLRAFFGIPDGLYTDLILKVSNPREVRKVAEKLTLLLPDTRPILREEILRTYDAIFNWREGVVFVLLMGALLAFVIFAWDKASGLSAEERQEIGILKAIGWETGDVIRMKFWEGGLISLSAFLLGYLLAYLHVFFADGFLFEPVLKGWATLYPAFRPRPVVDGLQLATLFFFSVFPYTLATLVPVWRAAITDPDSVMR
ncbi:MAG: FtsX-like permease family protein [Gammaproteobacteria bacterium]|nr:FtsX-like permease family protein [Gammaproteobacteria bacterium]MBU1653741.1 FtsX-like permease family protein [Gammaproteobacteria bacterium]MBU1959618.1 FtsX-like permease family protein [Gammaproteobacteria bacterium]